MLNTLTAGSVTFLSQSTNASSGNAGADRLLAHVQVSTSLNSLLDGVYAVDSLGDALQLRARLARGESVITRDGVWMGQSWLRVSRDQDVHAGVLARENEMRDLREQVRQAHP